MTYLKLIANAVWAGLYGSLLIAFLLFFLNDEMTAAGLFSSSFAAALGRVLPVYTPAIALLFPTLFVMLRFFAARRLGVGWLSLKIIVWTGAATLGVTTVVYYENLHDAGALLSPGTRDALRILCAAMALCWIVAVTAAGFAQRRPRGRRGAHRIAAGALLLAPLPMMAIMAPFMPRPAARPVVPAAESLHASDAAGPTLLMIGLDAASMDHILPLVSARELPTFERLLKEGGMARLNSISPCVSRVAWTVMATGMPPWSTGVRDRVAWSFGENETDVSILPGGLGMSLLARAGWIGSRPAPEGGGRRATFEEILRALRMEVRAVGWPGGPPPTRTIGADDPRVGYRLERILGSSSGPPPAGHAPLVALLREAIAADLSAREDLRARGPADWWPGPRLVAIRFPGLGVASRRFLRYRMASEFGDVTADEEAWFGPVVARYYQFADDLVAETIAAYAERAPRPPYVLVVSAYGIAPVSGWRRLVRQLILSDDVQAARPSGTWRPGPDGALLLQGPGVAPGAKLEEADILDVLPTALYALGAPVSGELRGQILRRLFTREHLESHPVQIVPGYGSSADGAP